MKQSRIFTNLDGDVIGIFGDGAEPPAGAIEVEDLPAEPLERAKDKALEVVKSRHASFLKRNSGNYSDQEVATWPRQIEWAKAAVETNDEYALARLAGMMSPRRHDALIAKGKSPGMIRALTVIGHDKRMDILIEVAQTLKSSGSEAIRQCTTLNELDAAKAQLAPLEAAAQGTLLQRIKELVD